MSDVGPEQRVDRDDCFFCGHDGYLERHHVIPDRHGGPDDDDNRVDVCLDCHMKLERLYSEEFYQTIGYGDVSDVDVFDARSVTVPFDGIHGDQPLACDRCERYGPFQTRIDPPDSGKVVECSRCGLIHVEEASE